MLSSFEPEIQEIALNPVIPPMSPSFQVSNRVRAASRGGFTLIELLSVMAVMAILAALVVGMSPGARSAARFNQNLANVASLLEQARQTAVTQNSYVYVGLLSSTAAEGALPAADKPGTYAVAFISVDGTDVLRSANQAQVGGGSLRLLDRIQKLPAAAFEESLPAENGLNGKLEPEVASRPGSSWSLKTQAGAASAAITFDRIIKFTPQGGARVGSAPVEAVEIVMRPSHGGTANGQEKSQAGVIRISGLTGKIDVHQPGA